MSFRIFVTLIFFGVIVSWIGWVMTVLYFDPEQISWLGFAMFYISLFLSLFGTFFLGSDWFKSKIKKKQLLFFRLRTSVRHSLFFSLLISGWLFLKSLGLIQWWVLSLFILILLVFEFFFMSLHKKQTFYERED